MIIYHTNHESATSGRFQLATGCLPLFFRAEAAGRSAARTPRQRRRRLRPLRHRRVARLWVRDTLWCVIMTHAVYNARQLPRGFRSLRSHAHLPRAVLGASRRPRRVRSSRAARRCWAVDSARRRDASHSAAVGSCTTLAPPQRALRAWRSALLRYPLCSYPRQFFLPQPRPAAPCAPQCEPPREYLRHLVSLQLLALPPPLMLARAFGTSPPLFLLHAQSAAHSRGRALCRVHEPQQQSTGDVCGR